MSRSVAMRAANPSNRTPLFLLLLACLSAGTGNGIAAIALPWLVLDQTGSATGAALVAATTSVPALASVLFSGTVVDRFGRRMTAMLSDTLSGLAVVAIPLLDATVGLSVLLIALCAVAGAVFDPAGLTAREAMLPEAAARGGVSLDRANSLYEAVNNVALLVGPGIGGVLVASVGTEATLWFTGAGFALAVAAISQVRMTQAGRREPHTDDGSFWHNTKQGLRFVWSDRLLRTIGLLNLGAVGVFMPIGGVLLPKFYNDGDNPQHLGWVIAAMSVGGLVGALAYGRWGGHANRRQFLLGSFVGLAVTIIGMAFLPGIGVMIALALVMGLTYGPQPPIVNVAMQRRTPEHLRGRVIGAMNTIAFAAGPLGLLLAGPLIDQAGLQVTFAGFAALLIPLTVATVLAKSLHSLNQPDAGGDPVYS